jgi:rfaE bifunctional protein kinase chain/domain
MDLNCFTNLNILVVGDCMLDRYRIGRMERISPEAPVPIVDELIISDLVGGAGNVAINIKSMMGKNNGNVDLITFIGKDTEATKIKNLLNYYNINLFYGTSRKKPTILKERIVVQNKHILRIDREDKTPYIDEGFFKYFDTFLSQKKYNILVISDYAKGLITTPFIDILTKYFHKNQILIDPKPENLNTYCHNYIMTPNEKEYAKMNPELIKSEYVIKTMGSRGMELIKDGKVIKKINAEYVTNADVTGAGDVVISAIAICIAMGIPISESMEISNKCASYSVSVPGTCYVPPEVFQKNLNEVIK